MCTQGGFCGVKQCVKERMGVVYEWKAGWTVCVRARVHTCCVRFLKKEWVLCVRVYICLLE